MRSGLDPWVRKISWRRKWQPTPVFLPGESHGQKSLVGCSPQSHDELDMTKGTQHTLARGQIRLAAVLLLPIMPTVADRILNLIGAGSIDRFEGNLAWGNSLEGRALGAQEILFPRP